MPKSTRSLAVPPRLAKYFQDYVSYHKTRGNKLTHYFGIPLIVVSLLGLLGRLTLGLDGLTGSQYFRLDGGTLFIGLALIWYFLLDWKITFPFGFVVVGLYFLGRALPGSALWTMFIAGWVLQGIGHAVFEKKSPAFFKNLTHVLIGPLWIFSRLVGYG